jgi:RND family efflux transporter MFP subunit
MQATAGNPAETADATADRHDDADVDPARARELRCDLDERVDPAGSSRARMSADRLALQQRLEALELRRKDRAPERRGVGGLSVLRAPSGRGTSLGASARSAIAKASAALGGVAMTLAAALLWTAATSHRAPLSEHEPRPFADSPAESSMDGARGTPDADVRERAAEPARSAQDPIAAPDVALTAAGFVVPRTGILEIASTTMGRIEEVRVSTGDRVKRGDLLVRLDARPARASAAQTRARLDAARAELTLVASRRDRVRRLRDARLLAEDEWERQASAVDLASALVREHEASLTRQLLDIESTEIRAPQDGVVLEVRREAGEVVTPALDGSGWLLSMTDLSEVRVVVDVHEADLRLVHGGQPATVELEAEPGRSYAARVATIVPRANRQKGTVAVEVAVLAPDERLRPDASARVRFRGASGGSGAGSRSGSGQRVRASGRAALPSWATPHRVSRGQPAEAE